MIAFILVALKLGPKFGYLPKGCPEKRGYAEYGWNAHDLIDD